MGDDPQIPVSSREEADSLARLARIDKLYQWERRTREIVQKIRLPLALSETLQLLVDEIGSELQVDRAFVIQFDDQRQVLPIGIEYRSGDRIRSFLGVTPPWGSCPYLERCSNRELVFREDTRLDTLEPTWFKFFREENICGFIASPVIYNDEIQVVLVLHTQAPRLWEESDIALLRVACDQVAISIQQALANDFRVQVKEVEERYRLIVENSQDGIFDWDLVTGAAFVNQRFFDLLGLPTVTEATSASPLGHDAFMSLIHPDDLPEVSGRLVKHFELGQPFEAEYRLRHASGDYLYVFTRGNSLRDQNGQTVRMMGSITDITALKQAQSEVKRKERQLQAVFDNALDMIGIQDDSSVFVDANPAFCEFLGRPYEEIVNKKPTELFGLGDEVDFDIAWRELIAEKRFVQSEFPLFHHDGTVRTIESNTVTHFLPGLHLSTGRDITRQRETERAIAESEARYRLIAQGANDGIWDWELASGVIYWNDRHYQLLGLDPAEFMPSMDAIQALIHPEDLEASGGRLRAHLADAGEQGKYEDMLRLRHADGSYRTFELRGKKLMDADGHPVRFAGSITDITERRLAEEELNTYARRLEQSNRELEQFATIASHDLQEPLRKVHFFGGMLAELAGEPGADYANRLKSAVTRMQNLMSDLLALSRVNRRGKPFRQVELDQILGQVLEDLEFTIQDRGAQFVVSPLPVIDADEGQLRQVLQNVVSNALKFNESEIPVVRIESRMLDSVWCQLVVEDNGIGFKPEFSERIFEPFERLHGKDRYPGTGMGLAICRKIIERHNGLLSAEGEPGKGSRFLITLPIRQP